MTLIDGMNLRASGATGSEFGSKNSQKEPRQIILITEKKWIYKGEVLDYRPQATGVNQMGDIHKTRLVDILNNPTITHPGGTGSAIAKNDDIFMSNFEVYDFGTREIDSGKEISMPKEKVILAYDLFPKNFMGNELSKQQAERQSDKGTRKKCKVKFSFEYFDLEGFVHDFENSLYFQKGIFLSLFNSSMGNRNSEQFKHIFENIIVNRYGPQKSNLVNKDGFYAINKKQREYVITISNGE